MSSLLRKKKRLDSQKSVRNYVLAGGEKKGSIFLFRKGSLGFLQLLRPSVSKNASAGEGEKLTSPEGDPGRKKSRERR